MGVDGLGRSLIDGVTVYRLAVHCDHRGRLTEILRRDEDPFRVFGQLYVTICYPGVVKAWHSHKRQTDLITVVRGTAQVALFDARDDSPTRGMVNEFFIGEYNPLLVTVPPRVLHGFKAVGEGSAYLLNCPNEPYDRKSPDEFRIDPFQGEIPYDWGPRHG